MSLLTGKCLCEAISYEIKGKPGPVFNCHCLKCRRWHGSAFRTRASIDISQFKWLCGEENLSKYESSDNVTKFFCKSCGSSLISSYKDKPNVLGIPLGGLEGDLIIDDQAHIFVDSKASWYQICDEHTQFSGWPGSEEKVRETHGKLL